MKVENPETESFKKYWEIKLFWSKIIFTIFVISFLSVFLIPKSEIFLLAFTAHFSGLSLISAVALYFRAVYEKGVEAAIDFMY